MFILPELGYEYNALEPYIDARTMEIHHTKHHKGYTDKFNSALEKKPELFEKSAEEIIASLEQLPEHIKSAVRNNGGGYVNHSLFWTVLKKDVPFTGEIKIAIERDFGSFEEFKKQFSNAAKTQFGSGWAWLVKDKNGKLTVTSTGNQDSPLTQGLTPILCLDVWEHAYYLHYQNKRPDYIESFFNIINWNEVNRRYKE